MDRVMCRERKAGIKLKKLSVDVMMDGYFKTTIMIDVEPGGHIDVDAIHKEVERRLPTLKGKDYQLRFDWCENRQGTARREQ